MVARAWLLLLLLCPKDEGTVTTPAAAAKLMKAYPQYITGYQDNRLLFSDGTSLLYDDGKTKDRQQLLDNADIQDQFTYVYNTGKYIPANEDPGRIRNEAFFKKLYGNTAKEVEKKIIAITWCPKLASQKIRVTTVNGLDKIVKRLSDELDTHPEFATYISNIGGTFNWRTISGTERLSAHSFGSTIDINVKYSSYWQWDCKCKDEGAKLTYTNHIPEALVAIFEKYGFIWGGKWHHYDTMHFEYRPELLP